MVILKELGVGRIQCQPSMLQRSLADRHKTYGLVRKLVRKRCPVLEWLALTASFADFNEEACANTAFTDVLTTERAGMRCCFSS